MTEPRDTLEQTRDAQDSLLLLWTLIGAAGLAFTGWMVAAPMFGCLGLPFCLLSALAFAVAVLVMGRLEVPWPRTVLGVVLAFGGLGLFFYGYLDGLEVVAEHFLDRPGAPSLWALWRSGLWVLAGAGTLASSVSLRRARGHWVGRALALITAATGPLAWGGLILAALLGLPLGA